MVLLLTCGIAVEVSLQAVAGAIRHHSIEAQW